MVNSKKLKFFEEINYHVVSGPKFFFLSTWGGLKSDLF